MADSANNSSKNSLDDFNDELDAMLDKAESSREASDGHEVDDDAIDRLLLAEELDAEDMYQADDSRDYKIDDIDLSDEFDDDFEKMRLDEEQEEEFDLFVDDETDSPDNEIPSEVDGLFEINDADEQESDASDLEELDPVDRDRQAGVVFESYQDNNFFADFTMLPDSDFSDEMDLFDPNRRLDSADTHSKIQGAAIREEKPETVQRSISMPGLDEVIARMRPRRTKEPPFDFDDADRAASDRADADQAADGLFPNLQKTGFEYKIKNMRFLVYIAIGLGSAALIAAMVSGLTAYSAKTEVSRLSERINSLAAVTGNEAEQSSGKELDDIKAAIEQLNQRVDGIMERLSDEAPLSAETAINKPIEGAAEKEIEAELNQLKDLQARLNALESKAKTEGVSPSAAIIKTEAANPAVAYAKTKEIKPQKSGSGKSYAASDWSVNLIAYRQPWHAKSRAAEFEQKGVPVDIIDVKVNNVTWYRLRVGGFKSKNEAASYAAKVKKILKLSSVWVGNDQS